LGVSSRLSLAILAFLSIASGGLLYVGVQHMQVTMIYKDLKEMANASKKYRSDTEEMLPKGIPSFSIEMDSLGENLYSVENWKGPYTKLLVNNPLYFYRKMGFNLKFYMIAKREDWGKEIRSWIPNCSKTSTTCYEWVAVQTNNVNKKNKLYNIFKKMDDLYDKDTGPHKGKIRYREIPSSPDVYSLYFKGPRRTSDRLKKRYSKLHRR